MEDIVKQLQQVLDTQAFDLNLWLAVETNNFVEVNKMLSQGADISSNEEYALTAALLNNNEEMALYLIECGANIHHLEDEILMRCTQANNFDAVMFLLKNGADPMAQNCKAFKISVIQESLELSLLFLEEGCHFWIAQEVGKEDFLVNLETAWFKERLNENLSIKKDEIYKRKFKI